MHQQILILAESRKKINILALNKANLSDSDIESVLTDFDKRVLKLLG
jgi:hypothetical protein